MVKFILLIFLSIIILSNISSGGEFFYKFNKTYTIKNKLSETSRTISVGLILINLFLR